MLAATLLALRTTSSRGLPQVQAEMARKPDYQAHSGVAAAGEEYRT